MLLRLVYELHYLLVGHHALMLARADELREALAAVLHLELLPNDLVLIGHDQVQLLVESALIITLVHVLLDVDASVPLLLLVLLEIMLHVQVVGVLAAAGVRWVLVATSLGAAGLVLMPVRACVSVRHLF